MGSCSFQRILNFGMENHCQLFIVHTRCDMRHWMKGQPALIWKSHWCVLAVSINRNISSSSCDCWKNIALHIEIYSIFHRTLEPLKYCLSVCFMYMDPCLHWHMVERFDVLCCVVNAYISVYERDWWVNYHNSCCCCLATRYT